MRSLNLFGLFATIIFSHLISYAVAAEDLVHGLDPHYLIEYINDPLHTQPEPDGNVPRTTRLLGWIALWQDSLDNGIAPCQDIPENKGLRKLATAEEPYKLPYVPVRLPRILGWALYIVTGCQGEPVKILPDNSEGVHYSDKIAEFTWDTQVPIGQLEADLPDLGDSTNNNDGSMEDPQDVDDDDHYMHHEAFSELDEDNEFIKGIRSIRPLFDHSENVGARYVGEVENKGVWEQDFYQNGLDTPFKSQYVYTYKWNEEIAEFVGMSEGRYMNDLESYLGYYQQNKENFCISIEPEQEQLFDIALLLYPYKFAKIGNTPSDLQVVGVFLYDNDGCWDGTAVAYLGPKDSTFDEHTYERRWKVPEIVKDNNVVQIRGLKFVTRYGNDETIIEPDDSNLDVKDWMELLALKNANQDAGENA